VKQNAVESLQHHYHYHYLFIYLLLLLLLLLLLIRKFIQRKIAHRPQVRYVSTGNCQLFICQMSTYNERTKERTN